MNIINPTVSSIILLFITYLPYSYTLLNHHWYVIGHIDDFKVNIPKKININHVPISIWRDKNNHFAGVSDVCPHRGVSLAKGRVDTNTNCIVCPYHTFKYNKKGRLVQTPGKNTLRTGGEFNLKTDVPYYKVSSVKDWVYLYNKPLFEIHH